MKESLLINLLAAVMFVFGAQTLYAQGVTTASMTGVVTDANGETLPGANVLAIHEPSGTRYGVATRNDGRCTILAMRSLHSNRYLCWF